MEKDLESLPSCWQKVEELLKDVPGMDEADKIENLKRLARLVGDSDSGSFSYVPADSQLAEIYTAFTYHPPKSNQYLRYNQIRSSAKVLAILYSVSCPDSEELRLAMTYLRISVMFANAAIASNE